MSRPKLNLRVIRHRADGTEIAPFAWRNAGWVALMVFDLAAAVAFFVCLK